MPGQLVCLPDNKEIAVGEGQSILEATLKAGIPHIHACGGKAKCSTCRILVLEGLPHVTPRNACEKKMATILNLPSYIRLACQTYMNGKVTIQRPVLDQLDKEIVQEQLKAIYLPQQMGEEKNIAILFSDIVAYTPFAELLTPYDTIHVLNRYFRLMGKVIDTHRGKISDYVGDGIMALFGLTNPKTAVSDAVQAGLEMFKVLPQLNQYLEQTYHKQFQIRIGIHYGRVVVGNVGLENMSKLAAVGDAVNMASRIENVNKELGTSFLLSECAYKQVADTVSVSREFTTTLRGKKGEYRLFEVNLSADPGRPVTQYHGIIHCN